MIAQIMKCYILRTRLEVRMVWVLNRSQVTEKCTQEVGHGVGTPWF